MQSLDYRAPEPTEPLRRWLLRRFAIFILLNCLVFGGLVVLGLVAEHVGLLEFLVQH